MRGEEDECKVMIHAARDLKSGAAPLPSDILHFLEEVSVCQYLQLLQDEIDPIMNEKHLEYTRHTHTSIKGVKSAVNKVDQFTHSLMAKALVESYAHESITVS